MDKFDEKIKAMAKSESWDIPKRVDNRIDSLLSDIEEPRKIRKPARAAIMVASMLVFTVTTVFAVDKIIEYFNYNKDSVYVSNKEEFEKHGALVNKASKDKGIEFTVDSISTDENYINVFYTIKSDKDINEYYKAEGEEKDSNAYFASPFLGAKIDGKDIVVSGPIEQEATYISEQELKGIYRFNISSFDIKDKFDITVSTGEIYRQQGNWSVSANLDKSSAKEESKTYKLGQKEKMNIAHDINGENVNNEYNITIDKVILSPFANQIFIKEKVKMIDEYSELMIGNSFALFDENNKSLDVIDKGMSGADTKTSIAENSFEFLKASMDTKTLTFVPYTYKDVQNKVLEPQTIDNLPIEFKISKYGKLIIEDIKISDKEIKYTYYKDGVVPVNPSLTFYNEDGKEVEVSGMMEESINRHTGRYTSTIKLDGYENNIGNISKIKKVSTFSNSDLELLYDKQFKIDLNNKK